MRDRLVELAPEPCGVTCAITSAHSFASRPKYRMCRDFLRMARHFLNRVHKFNSCRGILRPLSLATASAGTQSLAAPLAGVAQRERDRCGQFLGQGRST